MDIQLHNWNIKNISNSSENIVPGPNFITGSSQMVTCFVFWRGKHAIPSQLAQNEMCVSAYERKVYHGDYIISGSCLWRL